LIFVGMPHDYQPMFEYVIADSLTFKLA